MFDSEHTAMCALMVFMLRFRVIWDNWLCKQEIDVLELGWVNTSRTIGVGGSQLRSDPSPVVDSWGENDRGVSYTFGAGLSSQKFSVSAVDPPLGLWPGVFCQGHQVVKSFLRKHNLDAWLSTVWSLHIGAIQKPWCWMINFVFRSWIITSLDWGDPNSLLVFGSVGE